jgi:hypothetical protein
MKLIKYKKTNHIEGYIFDGTHESAKFIIEKIKEYSETAFKRIVYHQNLIDDTIKFEYNENPINEGCFIQFGDPFSPNNIGIWGPTDFERLEYILEE